MMRINIDTLRRALRSPFQRKLALASGLVVGGAVGLFALDSQSGSLELPSKAACCSGALAVGDAKISPPEGADKEFFEVKGTPAAVMFLVGNNESMQDFPVPLPEDFTPGFYPNPPSPKPGDLGSDGRAGHFINTGCSDPKLLAAMSWFSKDSTDPALNGKEPYDLEGLNSKFFDADRFYHARGRRLAWFGASEGPASLYDFKTLDSDSTTTNICYQAVGWKSEYFYSPVMDECEQCLATKGWWRGPMVSPSTDLDMAGPTRAKDEPPLPAVAFRKWIVKGGVLNLRPPKFVVARKVLKDVISAKQPVRLGVATFGVDHGWYDPPEILSRPLPNCSKAAPDFSLDDTDTLALKAAVNNTQFRHNERAIGEALFGLGGYFSSQRKDQIWENWFKQPLNPGSFGWPGCCNGGTYDNPYTGQEGIFYGVASDEWLKEPKTVAGVFLPGQPFEPWDPNERLVCSECQVNSVIVVTDGAPKYDNSVPITKMMDILTTNKIRHVTEGAPLVTFNPSNPETNPDVGGINYCDQFEKSPGERYTKEECDYTDWNWPTGLGVRNKNFMDDVAFFLANTDLRTDMSGKQTIKTYTIGYGDNSVMLQSIAMAGNGKFFRADNAEDLRKRINEVLGEIRQLSTSFATANIASVQTGGMQSSVYVPRFVPRQGRPYEGHLFRFFYYSEFAQGCQDIRAKSTAGDPFDLNRDKDCNDTFFLDKPAGFTSGVPDISSFTQNNIVQENTEGVWVKVVTAIPLDDGKIEKGTPAEPFWDFGETVGKRKAGLKCNLDDPLAPESGRCIFTLVDRDNDGKYTAADNPPVEFHEDNLALLKGSILAGGDDFCGAVLNSQNKEPVVGKPTEAQREDCTRQVIRYVRGLDVFDYDGDFNRDEERPCADNKSSSNTTSCKLADIFHSTPVTVEPPVEPFLCSLGLSSQCVSTLYEDFSATVGEGLCASGSGKPCYASTKLSPARDATNRQGSYDVYRKDNARRDRIALVGSNGGMLHAIHVGSAISGREKDGILDDVHDLGTGQEMWAFIPPDLLPKLPMPLEASRNHHYYVDGTAMVRDIWADGSVDLSRNGVKEPGEFRTVAVIGERSGGDRFTALDVTDPRLMLKAVKNPTAGYQPFRWMFPNACDKESLSVGQSWSNFAPKPPPIGPVRLKADASAPSGDRDRGWQERWVAVLNGGYSPDLSRGRGVYMVDAWSGENLWSAEAHPGGAPSSYQTVLNQMMPVVASAALVDAGKVESVQRDLDGFFDTMIVGDMGGQVWTFRFYEPGEVDISSGQVKNWFGARSLEVQREDGSAIGSPNGHEKAPFFHVAAAVLQPDTGWLRSYLGTGDRQHLRAMPSTGCSPYNLLACIRLKCNVDETFSSEINGLQRNTEIKYVGGVLQTNKETWKSTSGEACSNANMTLTNLTITCPASAYGTGTYPVGSTDKTSFNASATCSVKAGVWSCSTATLAAFKSDLKLNDADEWTVGGNSYYGFHSYGGSTRKFKDEAGAVAFDALRLTDKQGVTCGSGATSSSCSLVDVTIPEELYQLAEPDASGYRQRYIPAKDLFKLKSAGSEAPGWFMRYDNSATERTASGSTVLAGVVFWSSFAPADGVGAAACSLGGSGDMSYAWQADAITGLPDQAAGFKLDTGSGTGWVRGRGRPTTAPPGEPAPIIAMSKTGGIRYEVALSSPGAAIETEKLGEQKNVTPEISWLEVPRNLHECRHANAEACEE